MVKPNGQHRDLELGQTACHKTKFDSCIYVAEWPWKAPPELSPWTPQIGLNNTINPNTSGVNQRPPEQVVRRVS